MSPVVSILTIFILLIHNCDSGIVVGDPFNYYECNPASECVGESIELTNVATGLLLYANGYKSVTGSSSSLLVNHSDAQACCSVCTGSFSCAQISFMHVIDGIICAGSNSCWDVQNIITQRIWAPGASSLSHSTPQATNTIYCDGDASCQYAIINDAPTIQARGSFSLYKATITDVLHIELYGFYSGYQATIACTPPNVCNIFCYGTGCYGVTFDCSNNCNISPQNPIYLPPDLSLNFTGITNTNEELCSATTTATYDDFEEKYNEEMTYAGNGPICCRGSDSCTWMNYNGQKDIICSGKYSCWLGTITTNGAMFCEAERACGQWRWSDRTTRAGAIYCLAELGCSGITLRSTPFIYCTGHESCEDSNITSSGSDTAVYLLGMNSGYNMNFTCSQSDTCSIHCKAKDSCLDATVICFGTCFVECDDGSKCPDGTGWTVSPTASPSHSPTTPTALPTVFPTTSDPTTNNPTTADPTLNPTTNNPTTNIPTMSTLYPSKLPSTYPTLNPTITPTVEPTKMPTFNTLAPSNYPTQSPFNLTANPTNIPTINKPTRSSTSEPTVIQTIILTNTAAFDFNTAKTNKSQILIIVLVLILCLVVIVSVILVAYFMIKKKRKQANNTNEQIEIGQINSVNSIQEKEQPGEITLKSWLNNMDLMQYYNIFVSNGFDGSNTKLMLFDLSDDDLKDMGILIGHRKLILQQIDANDNSVESFFGDVHHDEDDGVEEMYRNDQRQETKHVTYNNNTTAHIGDV